MQGNIKALKYALNHELVYRDSAALLHKVGKPVPPYQKIQSRYNAVRVSSMKEAKEAKKAMQDLQNLANNRPLSIK
uniref:Uncharacterized protein n=1 Tax=Magallana gigas TaxID=29159 RepID=K1QHF6_MAGGI